MAAIELTTFGGEGDKALVLDNEEWGRDLSIGSDWSEIRLGILFALEGPAANVLNSQLRMGFSTGRADHIGSNNAQLFLGGVFSGSSSTLAGGTFTYNANAGVPYYSITGQRRVQVVAGTLSGSGGVPGTPFPMLTGANDRRIAMFVDLRKSGTSIIVGLQKYATTVAAIDVTLSQFLELMELSTRAGSGSVWTGSITTPTTGGNTTFANFPNNVAAEGPLIAAKVGIKSASIKMHLFAAAVHRIG